MQPHPSNNELLELIETIETSPGAIGIENLGEHILDAVSRITESPRSFLYLSDSRLPAPRIFLKGLCSDTVAAIEQFCTDSADLFAGRDDGVPIVIPSAPSAETIGNIRVFPLQAKENRIGLIGLSPVSDMASLSFITRLLRAISCTLNGLIKRVRIEQELSNLNKYLTVSSMLAQSMDLHELLEITLNCCMESVSAEAASILLLDDDKKNFCFYEIEGPAKPVLTTKTFPSDKGIAAAVLNSQQSENINDVQHDPRFFGKIDSESGFRTRNMLAIPLVAGDEKVGVLEVLNKIEGDSFTRDECLFLEMIAEEIAFAIRNAKIFDYVVNSYCKQRQGLASCKGCKRPLGSWTPCVKYQNLTDHSRKG